MHQFPIRFSTLTKQKVDTHSPFDSESEHSKGPRKAESEQK